MIAPFPDHCLQCLFMPSFVEIGLLVPEKQITEGLLSYIGKAAILVMSPGLFI